jgi:hypothetical protein
MNVGKEREEGQEREKEQEREERIPKKLLWRFCL